MIRLKDYGSAINNVHTDTLFIFWRIGQNQSIAGDVTPKAVDNYLTIITVVVVIDNHGGKSRGWRKLDRRIGLAGNTRVHGWRVDKT